MNCKKAQNKLTKLTLDEMLKPADAKLAQHFTTCQTCAAWRSSYMHMLNELRAHADFTPPEKFWDHWRLNVNKPLLIDQRSNVLRILDRLNWILIPERSLRWAMFVAIVLVVGIAFLRNEVAIGNERLPSQLIVAKGPVLVRESPNGVSFLQQTYSFQPEFNASNTTPSTNVKESI